MAFFASKDLYSLRHFHVAKMVLNANHEGCDSGCTFKLSPCSSEEFDHRKIAEADVDFFGRKLLFTLRQFDRTTERIAVPGIQLTVCHEFDFGVFQRARNFVEKVL
jgi:hypothetical protein